MVTQDTYRGEQNDPGTWHLYTYCSNDPINYTDPTGHWARNVHHNATKRWAKKVKMGKKWREILADADAHADDGAPDKNPYDMLQRENNNPDNWMTYFNRAVRHYKNKTGNNSDGLKNLGYALHMVQDWYAHRYRLKANGKDSKSGKYHSTWADDPKTFPIRIKYARKNTKKMIKLFKKKKNITDIKRIGGKFSGNAADEIYDDKVDKKIFTWKQYWKIQE